eukprot:2788840-Ditylum_brightwellii.AAC.1
MASSDGLSEDAGFCNEEREPPVAGWEEELVGASRVISDCMKSKIVSSLDCMAVTKDSIVLTWDSTVADVKVEQPIVEPLEGGG